MNSRWKIKATLSIWKFGLVVTTGQAPLLARNKEDASLPAKAAIKSKTVIFSILEISIDANTRKVDTASFCLPSRFI